MEKIFLRRKAADVSIVIPKDPTPVTKTASEELTQYLLKALDVSLPTVYEGEALNYFFSA